MDEQTLAGSAWHPRGGIDVTIDWLDLFDQEGVQFVVLDPSDDGDLIETLRVQPGRAIGLEEEDLVTRT